MKKKDFTCLKCSSIQNVIFISFQLVLAFWSLLKKQKGLSNCEVIVVQKSSTGDSSITLCGWGYYFLLFPRAFSTRLKYQLISFICMTVLIHKSICAYEHILFIHSFIHSFIHLCKFWLTGGLCVCVC